MINHIGGRSVLWSCWCPRPDESKGELEGWPKKIKKMMKGGGFYDKAEKMLRVRNASQKSFSTDLEKKYKIYGGLQAQICAKLYSKKVKTVNRVQPAPLAAGHTKNWTVDFDKYSTVPDLLELKDKCHEDGKSNFDIVTHCTVKRIMHDSGEATALVTSRGTIALRSPAKNGQSPDVILAVGCNPAATLLLNSNIKIPKSQSQIGDTYGAHFVSSIVARIPVKDLIKNPEELNTLEMGAIYLSGVGEKSKLQWHSQVSVLWDNNPEDNASAAQKYMPDVVATASYSQLNSSKGKYVVFVCAVLGEMETKGKTFHRCGGATQDETNDITANCRIDYNLSGRDLLCWEEMENATFSSLESLVADTKNIEYWHGGPDVGGWKGTRPMKSQIRVGGTVHESSVMPFGKVVGKDFRLLHNNEMQNVFITGSSMWPTAASWNPTMTMVAFAIKLAEDRHSEREEKIKASASKENGVQESETKAQVRRQVGGLQRLHCTQRPKIVAQIKRQMAPQ